MIKRKRALPFLSLVAVFLAAHVPAVAEPVVVPANATPPIVYVAGDGSGDFNCDGSRDQVEINAALNFVEANSAFTTVYLKGSNTYWIDEPIVVPNNMILTGHPTARVQVVNNADWEPNKPMICQKTKEQDYWRLPIDKNDPNYDSSNLGKQIYGTANDYIDNVEISGFELTAGNQDAEIGRWNYILIAFMTASNLSIHDMYLHGGYGDFIRLMANRPASDESNRVRNIRIYNNVMDNSGHDAIYIKYAYDVEIYNNEVYHTRTNCGIRVEQARHVSIHGNTVGNSMTREPSGYAGVYVGNGKLPLASAEIYGNYIFGKTVGIVLKGQRSKADSDVFTLQGAHVYHNRIYNILNYADSKALHGAIRLFGTHNTIVEYNVIEGSAKNGISWELGSRNSGTGYTTIVRYNVISNTAEGYAILNSDSEHHSFICDYNRLYNNAATYSGASSTTDVIVD